MSFQLPYTFAREGGSVIASCDVLDVHSQGRTEAEALDNLQEALQLFLETCLEMDSLDQVLKAQGFQLATAESTAAPDPAARMVNVPVFLLSGRDAQDHTH